MRWFPATDAWNNAQSTLQLQATTLESRLSVACFVSFKPDLLKAKETLHTHLQVDAAHVLSYEPHGLLVGQLVPQPVCAEDQEAVLGSQLVVAYVGCHVQIWWSQVVRRSVLVQVQRVQVHSRFQAGQDALLQLTAPLEPYVPKRPQRHQDLEGRCKAQRPQAGFLNSVKQCEATKSSHPEQPVVCDHRVPLRGRVLGPDPLHLSQVVRVMVLGEGQSAPRAVLLQHAQHCPAVAGVRHVDPICADVSHTGSAAGKCNLDRELFI